MSRSNRNRAQLAGLDRLETRSLLSTSGLSAANVPGNAGQILNSQFQSSSFEELGAQWWQLSVGGPVTIHVTPPPPPGTTFPGPASNTGLISDSQFNDHGFSAIGSQLKAVQLGGGLTIDLHDESLGQAAARPADGVGIPGAPANSGNVIGSQFDDSGFGNIGLQWGNVKVGGDLTIHSQTFVRNSEGKAAPRTAHPSATAAKTAATTPRTQANINTNLIQDSQFNDGGFGKVGMQWSNVQVGGSVGIGMESVLTPPPPPATAAAARIARTDQNATNIGWIQHSQFNDGGFGDTGFQWSNVSIGHDVATSSNALEVQPKTENTGPLTIGDIIFTGGPAAAAAQTSTVATPASSAATSPHGSTSKSTAVSGGAQSTVGSTNNATNSGLISKSQFSDGGFGDNGLQWRDVNVEGGVSSVHNSLSVQPENTGQGLITVHDVKFPSDPAPLPPPQIGAIHELPPTPPLIVSDGDPVTGPLPVKTKPFDTSFDNNFATNSGNIIASQVSDGGFGDIGMQWQSVHVGQNVRLVHNSLSVHPVGTGVEGISVNNVTYGTPLVGSGASAGLSLSPSQAAAAGKAAQANEKTGPTNDKLLISQQFTDSTDADVFLQWEGVKRGKGGLVIVNNVILIHPGPDAGPITLKDIHFPGMAPINDAATLLHAASRTQSAGGASAQERTILDSASNSGIILHNQFSDGGFGHIGAQWRDVHVAGTVTVVHNTLSVNVQGSSTGPINVSNVTFHSGALDNLPAGGQRIVAPPRFFSRIPFFRPNGAINLPKNPNVIDHATNSGILKGGQFAAGLLQHVFLQWHGVKIHGPVTIVDNILEVRTGEHGSGPINVEHVNFE
jgi:hypothetical protein